MIDGIIKADGTSRLMKSELPATYEEFRAQCHAGAQPLDVLFNAIGWSQLPTFLNKANLLKDATANLFGKSAGAVPDDLFAFLGKYNQHWWKLTGAITKYHLTSKPAGNYIAFVKDSSTTVYYSKEIAIDEFTGEITLVNPSIKSRNTDAYMGYYYQSKNGGIRYDINSKEATSDILYFSTGPAYWGSDDNGSQCYNSSGVYVYSSESYIENGATTYVQSTDRNAYPDSGIIDSLTYQYLGVPFDNAVTAPKIATGSYKGTGTYGSSNKNSLTFDFEPKIVIVHGGLYYLVAVYSQGRATAVYLSFSKTCWLTWDKNTFSWQGENAEYQLNMSNVVYNYIAIG